MNKSQEVLIHILSLAIHEQKATDLEIEKINWIAVLEEAMAHDVQSLLYTVLKDIPYNSDSWNKFITSLKMISIKITAREMQHNIELSKVLLNLKEFGVPIIAFKGIVLKELYPYPELRTMGDADLLVPIEYLDISKKTLEQLGYYKHFSDAKHITMVSNSSYQIELHRSLINHEVYKNIPDSFEKELWNNKITTTVCGIEVYTLSSEDHLLYLCHHMRTHILYSGFGIRQICDFVLFSESIANSIDWEKFFIKAEKLELAHFTSAIFEVSKQLFNLKVPLIASKYNHQQKTIKDLANYILRSGNFGLRVIRGNFNIGFLFNVDDEGNLVRIKPKYLLKKVFLKINRIKSKYAYSQKHSFLAPFACLQYIVVKTLYFLPTLFIDRRRNKLFSNLNLK